VSKGKVIVPFRIEDILPSRAMEYALSNTHWLDALTPPLEAHIDKLANVVSRLLGEPTPPTQLSGVPCEPKNHQLLLGKQSLHWIVFLQENESLRLRPLLSRVIPLLKKLLPTHSNIQLWTFAFWLRLPSRATIQMLPFLLLSRASLLTMIELVAMR